MPSRLVLDGRIRVDARPDRIDRRDRIYQPPLRAIPHEYPPKDTALGLMALYEPLVLDQAAEGACTGYGLAACINYQFWFRDVALPFLDTQGRGAEPGPTAIRPESYRVSPGMLYALARLYDEWDGDDYQGSSCRGAMRGWHHHGVCLDTLWPRQRPPHWDDDRWRTDAVARPLGAYYRVRAQSIADLQSAIHEVSAVFVSARIHDGWTLPPTAATLPTIPWSAGQPETGGHAFALIGYDPKGFLVQNSWGTGWGFGGFARLGYEDWLANGMDAWVAALGAPGAQGQAPAARADAALQINPAALSPAPRKRQAQSRTRPHLLTAWTGSDAYRRALVLGQQGRVAARLVGADSPRAQTAEIVRHRVGAWCAASARNRDVLLFALGGLGTEAETVERMRALGPYFDANGIYPLFLTWRSGLLETLGVIFETAERAGLLPTEPPTAMRAGQEAEARAYTIEAFAASLPLRSIWTEYKANARAAAAPGGGAHLMLGEIGRLVRDIPGLRLHAAAQSVGAVLLGHMVDEMRRRKLTLASLSLIAPACDMRFAARSFGRALGDGTLGGAEVGIDVLHDGIERADSVAGRYGRSLLYLISRALEQAHKTPLLGLHSAWGPDGGADPSRSAPLHADSAAWLKAWGTRPGPHLIDTRFFETATRHAPGGPQAVRASHTALLSDTAILTRLLSRTLGQPPEVLIDDLGPV